MLQQGKHRDRLAWELVEEHGFLSKVTTEIYHDPRLKPLFAGVAWSLGIRVDDMNCINCFGKALAQMKVKDRQRKRVMANINYIPKAGFPMVPGRPKDDKEAKKILRDNPNLIYYFSSYPENWQEDILVEETAPQEVNSNGLTKNDGGGVMQSPLIGNTPVKKNEE